MASEQSVHLGAEALHLETPSKEYSLPLRFYFTSMGVLPAYMSVHYLCVVLMEARRGSQISWDCSYGWL